MPKWFSPVAIMCGAMLALSPEERLKRVEEFVESVLEIRERNGTRPVF